MPKIQINGVIIPNSYQDIYDWFGIDATSPVKVNGVLNGLTGENVDVEINSPGGDVFSGSEIYTALKAYQGNVTVKIVGVAASAASIIAMAGDKVLISPTAQIMIHNVQSGASGDYRDMQKQADVLENYNKSMANAYMLKTGMAQDKLLELMNQETWMSAPQAKELGFADEIMFDNENKLVASSSPAAMLPLEVINKVRNLFHDKKIKDQKEALAEKERLELLKLRGKAI
ncbi:ATP-dependent Clp endopeptidase proteolytic subunit ClpP [Sporomusaceae bacterium BoRhaA]|uniref:head maturation protease, ClpP-related n=1 Tax=Pelorhabdus rhamnosifermentans TaxID=2772457 RepID=UPI001C061AD6|nr:head maturation protease, ClpP-related [Pelorhabdus rhamnosifermentans]MBU2703884.1 ATP-dependent Clp endopeptidase proteolytic subunit ClpP [Pelorhabdus rhamnosifermentans]